MFGNKTDTKQSKKKNSRKLSLKGYYTSDTSQWIIVKSMTSVLMLTSKDIAYILHSNVQAICTYVTGQFSGEIKGRGKTNSFDR